MANLPADLPEDWTQGQIVSPNGTEVGLSEKHGYNYLMQQVNAAQTAINNITAEISGALDGVAQETTSQSILTDTQKILTTLGMGTEQSVTEMLQTLLTQPNTIKNIQSGATNAVKAGVDIVLAGFTNLDKMFVILNSGASFYGANNTRGYYFSYCPAYKENLSLTQLSIAFSGASNSFNDNGAITGQVGYQVIEVY